jgi:hypothetical protein
MPHPEGDPLGCGESLWLWLWLLSATAGLVWAVVMAVGWWLA